MTIEKNGPCFAAMRNNRTVVGVGASHTGCSISEQRAVRTLLRRDER